MFSTTEKHKTVGGFLVSIAGTVTHPKTGDTIFVGVIECKGSSNKVESGMFSAEGKRLYTSGDAFWCTEYNLLPPEPKTLSTIMPELRRIASFTARQFPGSPVDGKLFLSRLLPLCPPEEISAIYNHLKDREQL